MARILIDEFPSGHSEIRILAEEGNDRFEANDALTRMLPHLVILEVAAKPPVQEVAEVNAPKQS